MSHPANDQIVDLQKDAAIEYLQTVLNPELVDIVNFFEPHWQEKGQHQPDEYYEGILKIIRQETE